MKKMKKLISVLCAGAVLATSAVWISPLNTQTQVYAEDGSGESDILPAPQNVKIDDEGYITWDAVEGAVSYLVFLRNDKDADEGYSGGNEYYTNRVEFDRWCFEWDLDFGVYSVKVCAIDKNGMSGDYSEPIKAEYSAVYEAPQNIVVDEENEIISWDAIDGVKFYDITIYDENNNRVTGGRISEPSLNYSGWLRDEGTFYFVIQALDQEYNVSEKTEPVAVSYKPLPAPANIRLDETGENIIWDAVDGADEYNINFNFVFKDANGIEYDVYDNVWTDEPCLTNWKSKIEPYALNGEYTLHIYAVKYSENYSSTQYSKSSEEITVKADYKLDEEIDMPLAPTLNDEGYLCFDNLENEGISYFAYVTQNGSYIDQSNGAYRYDFINIRFENYYPAGQYDIVVYAVNEKGDYNVKAYPATCTSEPDSNVWVPEPYIDRYGRICFDVDFVRHDNIESIYLRIRDAKTNEIVRLSRTWGWNDTDYLPDGDYLADVCACCYFREPEWYNAVGKWSEPLKIDKHAGGVFDDGNTSEGEIEEKGDSSDIPEEEKVPSVSVNPSVNIVDSEGNEIPVEDIEIKVVANYEEEEVEEVRDALAEELGDDVTCNLLELNLYCNGEDISEDYEGLVQVIITIPEAYRDSYFCVYRITKDEDGNIVKERVDGKRDGDNYIIYLEHFSTYALVGTDDKSVEEHEHSLKWQADENRHWHKCEGCTYTVDAADHTYETVIGEDGSEKMICSVCGYDQVNGFGDEEDPKDPEDPTPEDPTPEDPTPANPAPAATTTTEAAAEANTTAAEGKPDVQLPAVTTTTAAADNNGADDDSNMPTGLALTAVPVLALSAAAVISKKRK